MNSRRSYNQSRVENEGIVVTRAFKIFRVEPHPRKKLLILKGEINISIVDNLGEDMIAEETRDYRKVLRLDHLREDTDVGSIVDAVLSQCPFIEAEIISGQLIPVIEILKNRHYDRNGIVIPEREDNSKGDIVDSQFQDFPDYFEDSCLEYETDENYHKDISMTDLDKYVDLLYEDISDKARGARFIYLLCKKNENLNFILLHETALNAVFRTLREDYKKSMFLTTNLLGVCNCYAQFIDFHDRLINDKICSLTFDIIEFELDRYGKGLERIQEQTELVEAGERQSAKKRLDKMRDKFLELTKKQDNLLKVAFEVVMRLSEEKILQRETIRRGIIGLLINTLERKHVELLLVVTKFLKNLSIYIEAKIQMSQYHIVEKMTKIFQNSQNFPPDLNNMFLRLLYNLSFDTKCRHKMVKFDLLPKIAQCFADPGLEQICLNLLYIFSMDRILRAKMAPTSIPKTIMRLILEKPTDLIEVELSALAINLAANKHCAKEYFVNDGLRSLLGQAFANQDVLVMKIVRNLSLHEGDTKNLFIDFTSDLANAVCAASSEEFVLECLGTLGNLTLSSLDFRKLLVEFQLVPWLKTKIVAGSASNSSRRFPSGINRALPPDKLNPEDFLLEVVMFIGTCCGDPECGDLLIKEGLIDSILNLFQRRGRDTLIRVHILYAFYKLSQHQKTRGYLVEKSKIPQMLLDLLRDPSPEIRELSENTLDLIGEFDDSWKTKIQSERCTIHNEEWFEVVAKDTLDASEILDPLAGELLDTSIRSDQNYSGSDSASQISDSEIEDSPKQSNQFDEGCLTPSIFDRFRYQYEQEKLEKKKYDYILDDENSGGFGLTRFKASRVLQGSGTPFPSSSSSSSTTGYHKHKTRKSIIAQQRAPLNVNEIHNPLKPTVPSWS